MILIHIIINFDKEILMDIRNIKTFARVAELGSISKTAEELCFAQSTVTVQIQQLEKELGYPLFDRIGKKISLTEAGKKFLFHAYEILHSMERAKNIDKELSDLRGMLRVGVSESLMIGILIDLIPSFKKRYPYLDLRLKTGHTTQLLEQLKQNQLDIIYISQSENTDPDLRCHYKHKEELIFLCAPNHPLAKQKKVTPHQLMEYDFLVTEREGICYRRLREIAAQYAVTMRDSVEVDSVHVITQLLKTNIGIAFLPQYAVAKELAEGKLIKIDTAIEPQIYFSQILCHKNRWLSPFMEKFIEAIQTERP